MKKDNRIGKKIINNQGLEMTIIEYYNCKNITVQFEDGVIIYKKRYAHFREGNIENPNHRKANFKNRIGEEIINSQGFKMAIIEYEDANNLNVQFEDGIIVEHRAYSDFKKGNIAHPSEYSDGISIPEKFMINVFKQLNIEFIAQLSKSNFEWCQDYRYDFYIPSLNMIIETHGLQHYKETNRGRGLKFEQENDKAKKELALKNGIQTYIVVDCRYSEFNWLKENLNKELRDYLNLLNIDWDLVWGNSLRNLVYETKKLIEEGYMDIQIAEILNISTTTIINYKKQLGIKTLQEIREENIMKTKELLQEGKLVKEIAEILGVNRKTVEKYKKELNIETPQESRQKNLLKAKDLFENGYTIKKIAEILNLDKTTIYKYKKELNL